MKIYKVLIFIYLLHVSYLNAEEIWTLVNREDNIYVYTKKNNKNKPKTFKAILKIKGSIDSVVSVFYDLNNYPIWLENCVSANLYKRINFKENYIYQVSYLSFPFRNRDVVYHTLLKQEGKNIIISFESDSKMYMKNINTSSIQINFSKGEYRFNPINKDETVVSFEIFVDLGSSIPLYLTNLTLERIVLKSLLKLSNIVNKKPYKKNKLLYNIDNQIIGIK